MPNGFIFVAMNFVYPSFLWALLAIAIPIIIHLLNFRRYKKVYFTNVHLLKEVKQEKNRTDNLKRWLILVSRILAIIFLVLAFAQPFIDTKSAANSGKKRAAIYLDNSFSMQQIYNNQPLLEEARQKAIEVVSSFNISDEFILITNDLKFSQLRWMSKDEMLDELLSVKTSPSSLGLSEVYNLFRQQNGDKGEASFESYVFSDFQKSFSDDIENNEDFQTFLIPLKGTESRNMYVDSAWLTAAVVSPQTYAEVVVKTINSGDIRIENRRITLKLNKEPKAISDISLDANTERLDTFRVFISDAGNKNIQVHIADFPITHDDDFYLNFKVEDQVKVLEIKEKNSSNYFRAVFKDDSYVLLEEKDVNQINYSSFSNYHLIILNEVTQYSSGLQQSLQKYMEQGGGLYIIPPTQSVQSLNDFLNTISLPLMSPLKEENQQAAKVNLEDPVFKTVFRKVQENMDLPRVSKYYPFLQSGNTGFNLITLRNGQPLIVRFLTEKSTVFLQTTPLSGDFSTLAKHALFPALAYNAVLFSKSSGPLYYTIRPDVSVVLVNSILERDKVVKIASETREFIPEQRMVGNQLILFPGTLISESGHYQVLYEGQTASTVSFNYDRSESEFLFLSDKQVGEKYNSDNITTILTSKINDISQISGGIRLWKICIILCLLFLAAEILLIKYYSGRKPVS